MFLRLLLGTSLSSVITFAACADKLFGLPVSLQGQKDAAMLYASILTEPNPQQDLITLTTEGYQGMGNFSYVMTFSDLLEQAILNANIQRIMGGSEETEEKVGKIYNFPSRPDDIWYQGSEDEYVPTENTSYLQKLAQSQTVYSFVIPPPDLDPLMDLKVNWMYFREIHSPDIDASIHKAQYLEMLALLPSGHQLTINDSFSVFPPSLLKRCSPWTHSMNTTTDHHLNIR
ncbi:hypothetical protein GZ77_16025 [Endozoicomonas montiporae]|uniref:Lipoprotein n=2 Tax=Endozoicomonas montiporae TaxID=1027273 RepID=A0A081N5R6_9GAMM|nr:hypothetical protein [Endozoicomonas montiporae]AMO57315.1 hypothetical protein EZMO1_3318 [Endozoicomonas montiporae CL-33]KEQ13789.1 hypothetical protein GZ77_16025 [Endozoicomonas montiporae]